MLRLIVLTAALFAFLSLVAPSSASAADTFRAEARFGVNDGPQGKSRYREFTANGSAVRRLQVEVEDYAPNATFDVFVNGAIVGRLTTNGLGTGKLTRQTTTDDPDQQGEVPVIKDGDTIAVGDLSGTFRAR